MKNFIVIILLFLFSQTSFSQKPESTDAIQKASISLIQRVLPKHFTQFEVQIEAEKTGKDYFQISSKNNKIVLKGNNPVSVAMALNQYLKYTCNVHLSWTDDQLNLPKKLPLPQDFHLLIEQKHRVYFNYCTMSYTAPWWDWKRWEREIDFMAMNGINTPLSVIGLEGVWYKTLLKMNFTDLEARSFLVGPAYFAWQWMTNIQSFGGPLPKSWIDSHLILGKQIIDRELSLGMQPIQQGFSGCVPLQTKVKFPDSKYLTSKSWLGFEGVLQIDPLDPLFNKFGKVFLETQEEIFGKYGFYAADPFHESEPPQKGEKYLNDVGVSIFKLMTDFDNKATWVMQGWDSRKEIAVMVPKGKLLILDLSGSKYKAQENFWGHEFVVGNLHNFGGRINMHGDLNLVASNQYRKALKDGANAVGSGLFMEAVNQNPVYYDLAFEMPNHKEGINASEWLKKYSERRYGAVSENAQKAWQILLENPYRKGTNGVENSSIIAARPAVNVKKSGPNAGLVIPYSPDSLQLALEYLLKDKEKLKKSKPYLFDIVDVERQVLTNLGQKIAKSASKAFTNKDLVAFDKHSNNFLNLLSDVDKLLKTRSEFSFDKWASDAKSWATNDEERELYEFNASMLVTQWGPSDEPRIFDYSWREWSGLIEGYYKPRWSQFYSMLRKHLVDKTEYSEKGLPQVHGRESFRANSFYSELADWETNWIKSQKSLNPTPTKNEVKTVEELLAKYKVLAKEY